jgi:Family of unknown function (DUF6152)
VRIRTVAVMIVAVAMLAISVPVFAHHGNAVYDVSKKLTIKGVVTEFIWANPHCWLKLDAKGDNGELVHWVIEASNPPDQTKQGWTNHTFKPGDEVEITLASAAKNGEPIGRFGGRIVINGKVFKE